MLYKHCCVETAQHFVLRSMVSGVRSELRPGHYGGHRLETTGRCWAHQICRHHCSLRCHLPSGRFDTQISIILVIILSVSGISRGQQSRYGSLYPLAGPGPVPQQTRLPLRARQLPPLPRPVPGLQLPQPQHIHRLLPQTKWVCTLDNCTINNTVTSKR